MLKLVDPQTFEVRQVFRAPQFSVGTIWCTACMSPDGQHVAAGSGNGTLYVWNVSFPLNIIFSLAPYCSTLTLYCSSDLHLLCA